jgi:hypothetical protein
MDEQAVEKVQSAGGEEISDAITKIEKLLR